MKDNGIYNERLVVGSFCQIKEVDYKCTYSPKIEMDSFRQFLLHQHINRI